MKHLVRRIAAVSTLAVAGGVLVGMPAQATTAPEAQSTLQWLGSQLTAGVLVDPQYDFANFGPTIDVLLAAHQLGEQQPTQDAIVAALEADPTAYVGSGGESYAGSYGKLATAVEAVGGNLAAFGGLDVLGGLEDLVTAGGAADGRVSDASAYGDYSSTITQAWAVRGLAGASSSLADEALAYLLKQQCADGSFRSALADAQCTTGGDDVDSTALAVEALVAAGAPGEAALGRAGFWLSTAQHSDGSFSDPANANSTGLASQALAHVGAAAAARAGAGWLYAHVVTAKNAEGTPLAKEVGAIAYDDETLTAARTDGITDATRTKWMVAATQAVVALNSYVQPAVITNTITQPVTEVVPALGASKLKVTVKTTINRRAQQKVTVTGFAPHEAVRVTYTGKLVKTGYASAKGTYTVTFRVGAKRGIKTIAATGAFASRNGTAKFRIR